MNVYEVLLSLWRVRLAALITAVLAAIVGILAAYHVPSLKPRALQMGVASETVLVDTHRSSIGSTSPNAGRLESIASTYTELASSQAILGPIARALHVSSYEIGVETQVTNRVPLAQSQPLEPQVGTEILATRHRFELDVHKTEGSSIIGLYGQAPSGREAMTLVTAAARSYASYASGADHRGRVTRPDQVIIRPLGHPTGRTLNADVSLESAILVALVAWVLAMTVIITLRTQARLSRAKAVPPAPAAAETPTA